MTLLESVKPPRDRRGRRPPTRCSAQGCECATRHGKDYCRQHLTQGAYVRGVLDRMAALERERACSRAVRAEGMFAHDVASFLYDGASSVAAIAKGLWPGYLDPDEIVRVKEQRRRERRVRSALYALRTVGRATRLSTRLCTRGMRAGDMWARVA